MSTFHGNGLLHGAIVVGVRPHQHPRVLSMGVWLAAELKQYLVCVYVISRPALGEQIVDDDTDFFTLPQPERDEFGGKQVDDLQHRLEEVLLQDDVPWILKIAYGDPARALAKVAEQLEATLLVIGSHQKRTPWNLGQFRHNSMVLRALLHPQVPVVLVPTSSAKTPPSSVVP